LAVERTSRNAVFQGRTIQILHGDEQLRFMPADFVDSADIGMVERRGCSRFAAKSLEGLRVVGKLLRQELQRAKAAEISGFGLVHHTHPAPAELLQDAVMRNGLSDERLGLRHLASMLALSAPSGRLYDPETVLESSMWSSAVTMRARQGSAVKAVATLERSCP